MILNTRYKSHGPREAHSRVQRPYGHHGGLLAASQGDRLEMAALGVLLLAAAFNQVSAGLPPVADCASLAEAQLGPNITVISAVMAAVELDADSSDAAVAAAPTCTFVADTDVGDPSTIITSFKGLVDRDKCCAACYANPKCGVSIVLKVGMPGFPAGGCWLKSGAGTAQSKKGATTCRTF